MEAHTEIPKENKPQRVITALMAAGNWEWCREKRMRGREIHPLLWMDYEEVVDPLIKKGRRINQ